MFGSGIIRGLSITLRHFVETYVDDWSSSPTRYENGKELIHQEPDEFGLFTIQYPEEKRRLPEAFRYFPMLLYDDKTGEERCTACGICANVCPGQCIWIERAIDPKTKKPQPHAEKFFIDTSICLSCGLCAEFCPFDAIKMNHEYELAVEERHESLLIDKEHLLRPVSYYAKLYPTRYKAEEEARAAKKTKREKK